MTVAETAKAIRGVAALLETLNCIGGQRPNVDNVTDHDLAKIVVDNEMEIRAVAAYALSKLVEDC